MGTDQGNDGYVSFEVDPLLEDVTNLPPREQAVKRYIELGKKWAAGHKNRMIKGAGHGVWPCGAGRTCGGGITLNVTLIFSERQYKSARDAVRRGAATQERAVGIEERLQHFRVARRCVHGKTCADFEPRGSGDGRACERKAALEAQSGVLEGQGLAAAAGDYFRFDGNKKPTDPPDKYVEALAGSDIQTNPPATNVAVEKLNKQYTRKVDQMPADAPVAEIDAKVDVKKMEDTLMQEGTVKFADPQKALLKSIADKCAVLAGEIVETFLHRSRQSAWSGGAIDFHFPVIMGGDDTPPVCGDQWAWRAICFDKDRRLRYRLSLFRGEK